MNEQSKEQEFWRFDDGLKPLIKINDTLYTLDGWNGKTHQFCRIVLDFEKKEVIHTLYSITPVYIELNDELEDFDIVGYEVSLY